MSTPENLPNTPERSAAGRELMAEMLADPAIITGIRKLSRLTHEHRREGAMAVYRTDDGYESSEVLYPSLEEIRGDGFGSVKSSLEAMSDEYNSVDSSSITMFPDEEKEDFIYRNDIIFDLHSHSTSEQEDKYTRDYLCPSLTDLTRWEELSSNSPDVVSAVLVTNGKAAQLLLYKSDATGLFIPRYIGYEDRPIGRNTTLDLMRRSHINVAELTIPHRITDTAAYTAGLQKALDDLYS